ncbi:MAG: VPA1267 family protein [Ramlibacter sp.]|nr:VPA1267 family protein [Ramlibacter sp.]
MNGQEQAEQNYHAWRQWLESKDDRDFRALAAGGKLKRSEIIRECGFNRSALRQNPRIKAGLAELESDLRERGILAAVALESSESDQELEPLRQRQQTTGALTNARLQDLERRVQTLDEENKELRGRLARFENWERHLLSTGRMPR